MPVPSNISDLSKVPSENSPAGTESAKGTIDDYFRAHASFIRILSDLVGGPTVQLPSAATVSIGFAGSANVQINGTTTITAFDTIAEGTLRWVSFGGALTLTHNAASLILPGGANIQTVAGDIALFKSLSSGFWKCMAYQRLSGAGVVAAAAGRDGYLTAADWAFFNGKQAAGICLPLSGGLMSGSVTYSNNTGVNLKDSGGTTRQLFNFAADNSLNWTIPGGSTWNVYDQAGSAVVWNLNNNGDTTQAGTLTMANSKGIFSKDIGGTSRQLMSLAADNNVYHYVAGGGLIRWYNQAGTTELASLSNSGAFTAVSVTETSDGRLKKLWRRLSGDLLKNVAAMKKVGTFVWRRDGTIGLGCPAQDLEAFMPWAVHTGADGVKSVRYGAAAFVIVVELTRAYFAHATKTEKRLAKLEAR